MSSSTRSTSSRPYQERSKTVISPDPGSDALEAPEEVVAHSSSVGGPIGHDAHVARVEARGEPADGAALAGGVEPLEEDDEPRAGIRRLEQARR